MTELYLTQTIPGRNWTGLSQAAATPQPLHGSERWESLIPPHQGQIGLTSFYLGIGANLSVLKSPLDTYHFHQNYTKTARHAFPFFPTLTIHTYRCPFLFSGKYPEGAGWTWAFHRPKQRERTCRLWELF